MNKLLITLWQIFRCLKPVMVILDNPGLIYFRWSPGGLVPPPRKNFWVLLSYTTAFHLYDRNAIMNLFIRPHLFLRPHFVYTTAFCLYDRNFFILKYGLYSPKFFRPQIKNWYPIKIFSLPTHPHSTLFTHKHQNFSYF